MDYYTDDAEKRFLKISYDSGCFLANYQESAKIESHVITVYEKNEQSGVFKFDSQ